MLKAKKLDLIVANVVLEKTLEILDKVDANYTVFKDIMGKGILGSKSAENVLTILSNTYIIVVSTEDKIKKITDIMEPILESFGGTYFIQDSQAWDKASL
jgi:nitrogen regulatory protein PII